MRTGRRALVLATDAANHPFRRALPPHVLVPIADEPVKPATWRITLQDGRDFLMAYCAMFLAVSAFIS